MSEWNLINLVQQLGHRFSQLEGRRRGWEDNIPYPNTSGFILFFLGFVVISLNPIRVPGWCSSDLTQQWVRKAAALSCLMQGCLPALLRFA